MQRLLTQPNKVLLILCVVFGLALVLLAHTATAAPNYEINYQGKLTDNSGAAVADGTYNMRFWLLQSTGQATTSAVFTEELTGVNRVQVTNGLFSVMLGSTTDMSSVDFNQTLYLGVEIGGTGGSPSWDGEMSPRKVLGTVPSAFEAKQLGGVASTSFLRSDADDTATGLLTFTGTTTFSTSTFALSSTTILRVAGESFTDLTGSGLTFSGGALVANISESNLNITGGPTNGYVLQASSTAPGGFVWQATSSLGFVEGEEVTLAGEDYLTLSGQQITANAIDPDNLSASDFGDFTCNGTSCSLDTNSVQDNEIDYSAVTLSDFTDDVGYLQDITGSSFYDLADTLASYTENRILFQSGFEVTDSANLTFNGTTLAVPTLNLTNALAGTEGGTGLSSVTQNQLLIGGAGNTWTQVATSSLGLGDGTFLGLSDTFDSYTADRILFTTASGIASSSALTFDGTRLNYTYASGTSLTLSDKLFSATIGIGTTTPQVELVVDGDFHLTGGLFDNSNTRGSNGQILQTTGSGISWVATTSLGFVDTDTDTNNYGPTIIVAASNASNTARAHFVADGTNDQDTIEQALAALPTSGGTVLLTEGTFSINNEINITQASTTLIGSGPATILAITATSTSWDMIDVASTHHIVIKDLAINGGAAAGGSQDGLVFNTVSTSTIEKVEVKRMRSDGIRVTSSNNTILNSNFALNNVSTGFYLESSSNNTFTGNTSHNSNRGFHLVSSDNNVLVANIADANQVEGFFLQSASNNLLSDNYASNHPQQGISLLAGTQNSVVNNIISSNGRYAIHVNSSSQNTIANNKLQNNGHTGVYASIRVSGDSNLINGNTISATSTDPLIQISTGAANLVANNTYTNSDLDDSTFVSDSGTGTRYDDYNRTTLTTATEVGYNLFKIYGSSSLAIASTTQLGSGNIEEWGNSSGRQLTLNNSGYLSLGTTTANARLSIQTTGTDDILNLFETGGQEVFTVLESGNVGVGSSSPNTNFVVSGEGITLDGSSPRFTINASSAFSRDFFIDNSGGTTRFNYAGLDFLIPTSSGGDFILGNTGTDLDILSRSAADGGISFFNNTTETMTIQAFKVGIGSTTPSSKLTVAGTTHLGGNLTATGTVTFSALTDGLLLADGNGLLSAAATGTLGLGDGTFLGLSDTPSGYNANGLIFASSSGDRLIQSTRLTYNNDTFSLQRNINSANALGANTMFLSGSLSLGSGQNRSGEALYISGGDSVNGVTGTISGNELLVARSNSAIGGSGVLNITGAAAMFTDNCSTLTGGTCNSSASVVEIWQQGVDNTGAALNVVSASTNGGLVFRANDDGTDTDSTPFVIDSAGLVGVGTTSPASKLDVWGDFRVGTGSTPTLFTDVSTGRVGIGTLSPTAALRVGSAVGDFTTGGIAFGDGTDGLYQSASNELAFNFDGTDRLKFHAGGDIYSNTSHGFRIDSGNIVTFAPADSDTDSGLGWNAEDSIGLFVGGVQALTATTSGNVGIGSTTPGHKLTVAGTTHLGGNLTATGTVTFSALTDGLLLADSNGLLSAAATGTLGLGDGTFLGLSDVSGSYAAGRIFYTNTAGDGLTSSSQLVFDGNNLIMNSNVNNASTTSKIDALDSFLVSAAGDDNRTTNSYNLYVNNFALTNNATTSGSVLHVKRSNTTSSGGDLVVAGALGRFEDTSCSNLGNTCITSANGVEILQSDANNTGSALNITTASTNGGLVFRANDDGTLTDTTPFVIDSAGNVGIGSTTPSSKLTVAGGNIHVGGIITSTSTSATSTLPWLTSTNFALTGKLYDGNGAPGTNGMILSSTGSGVDWLATSSLNIALSNTTGILGATRGGTGLSSVTENQLLIGAAGNTWTQIATGSLGFRESLFTDSGASTYLTSLSDNLGIGTTSANSKLDVWGDFRVGTSGVPLLFADTSANQLIIGTSTPSDDDATLYIAQTADDRGLLLRGFADESHETFDLSVSQFGYGILTSSNVMEFNAAGGARQFRLQSSGALFNLNANSGYDFSVRGGSDNNLIFGDAGTDRVGIGTGTPASKLDVWGDFRVGTSGVPTLFADVSTGRVGIGTDAPTSGSTLHVVDNYARILVDGPNADMQIDRGSVNTRAVLSYLTNGVEDWHIGLRDSGEGTSGGDGSEFFIGPYVSGVDPVMWFETTGNVAIGTTTTNARFTLQATGTDDILNLFETGGQEVFTVLENGRVGIGTSTPGYELVVDGSILTTDGRVYAPNTLRMESLEAGADTYFTVGGTNAIAIVSASRNVISKSSSGNTNLIIGNDIDETGTVEMWGDIGIGTSSPASRLDVWGDFRVGTSGVPTLFADVSTNQVGIGTGTFAGTEMLNIVQNAAGGGLRISDSSGALKLHMEGSGFAQLEAPSVLQLGLSGSSASERQLYLNSAGVTVNNEGANYDFRVEGDTDTHALFVDGGTDRVGIGTTSPASKLDVWGDFRVGTGSTPALFTDVSTGRVGIGTTSPTFLLTVGAVNDNSAYFAGDVGIGDPDPTDRLSILNGNIVVREDDDQFDAIKLSSGNSTGGIDIYKNGQSLLHFTSANELNYINQDSGGFAVGTSTVSGAQFSVETSGSLDIVNLYDDDGVEVFTVLENGRVGIGSTSPTALFSIRGSGFSGTNKIFGIDQYFTSANTVQNAVQYGARSYIDIDSNTATTTFVGSMSRIEDNTSFGNTIRGLEVQADKGVNTLGENTALSGFARTFGVRGTTRGDAGGNFAPAGGFFESEGTTQGNAIRGFSDTITTSDLLVLFQDTSAFAGTGLLMNFGNSGGSFSSSTSKFVDFQNAGSSYFTVSAYGTTTIGRNVVDASAQMAGLQIGNGGICVDNDGACTASTSGRITAKEYGTAASDLAEIYFSSEDLRPGELVYGAGGLSIKRASREGAGRVLGVVSTKPGLTLGYDDSPTTPGETGYPLALTGRVPIRLSTENGPIAAGDELMLSSIPGVAMKATSTGVVVGIALEDFAGEYAYSETYLNQFAEDVIEPNYKPVEDITDPRIHDGCYYSGGNASGEEECTPLEYVDEDDQVAEAERLARLEAEYEAYLAMQYEPVNTEVLDNGRRVAVGQIVMFVDLHYRYLTSETESKLAALMHGTSTVLTLDGEEEVVEQSLFDRMAELASRFVDGVLSVLTLKAERVETNELCVDEVCVTADDLRALLESAHAETPAEPVATEEAPSEEKPVVETPVEEEPNPEPEVPEEPATTTPEESIADPATSTPEAPATSSEPADVPDESEIVEKDTTVVESKEVPKPTGTSTETTEDEAADYTEDTEMPKDEVTELETEDTATSNIADELAEETTKATST